MTPPTQYDFFGWKLTETEANKLGLFFLVLVILGIIALFGVVRYGMG